MNAVTSEVDAALQECQGGASWTLYLDKLSFPCDGGQAAKGDKLKRVVEVFDHDHSEMEGAAKRYPGILASLRRQFGEANVRAIGLCNTSRLLLHLARPNPLENVGLYTERITGLPVIPGTAIKGVVSTWACWCQNIGPDGAFPQEFAKERGTFSKEESRLAKSVLGDNANSGSQSAGEVIFFGAWPEKTPTLELDITTPHADDKGKGPTPNPFLAIAPGTDWCFVLLAKPRENSNGKMLLDTAELWLTEALDQAGIGAKTAAGYGRFGVNPERQAKAKVERDAAAEKQRRAALLPDAAKMQSLGAIQRDGDLFCQVNLYKGDPRNWTGTDAERLAVLEFCRTSAWDRVKNNKNCLKALQNLAVAFGRELPT